MMEIIFLKIKFMRMKTNKSLSFSEHWIMLGKISLKFHSKLQS